MLVLRTNKLVATIVIVLLTPSLQAIFAQSAPSTTNANDQGNPDVYPPDSAPYGMSYGEWSAKWWQWLVSIPQDVNPHTDTTGAHCAQDQSGPVWFLSAGPGESDKSCTIPEGKAILFSIISRIGYKTAPTDTEADLRTFTKNAVDHVSTLEGSIDGTPLQNLKNYRAASPLFNLTFTKNNIFGQSEGTTVAVSDGYWILLKPLPVGSHTVFLRGAAIDLADPGNNFVVSRTWHLTIAPTNGATATAT